MPLQQPKIMGVLNVTPDSFSDGGRYLDADSAVAQAMRLAEEGADIIDVGGESTRPGAQPVPGEEELRRVVPVIKALRGRVDRLISIDTSKPEVMRAAVAAGAGLINDVSALRAPGAVDAAAELRVPVCLMHMKGEPRSMQINPHYENVVVEVRDFLLERAAAAQRAGIGKQDIYLDPGFGFGKTLEHNLALLRHLDDIVAAGYPVLVGMSRKSMVGALLDTPVDDRVFGSVTLAAIAAMKGAAIIRVHDVKPTRDALKVCGAVMAAA